MGTHPIFESDFDCLTENVIQTCLLLMGFVSADQPDDQYDYVYEETKYEGVCVLSHNHKDAPSPEPMLNGECRQWRNNSCCMPESNQHLFGSETTKTKFK